MFISPALAQATETVAQQGSIQGTIMQLGLIFVIFYLLLIRPQQKKLKQHQAMLDAVKKGDKIVTGGGIYATVVKTDDTNEMTVEIANGITIQVNRTTIRDVINENLVTEIKNVKKKSEKKIKVANSNKAEK